jgi:phosphohistidine phosphatase
LKTDRALAPGAAPAAILKASGWPDAKTTAVVVGHQPDLGRLVGQLVAGQGMNVSIRKGGLWWISNRVRDEKDQVVVRAVVSPDLL